MTTFHQENRNYFKLVIKGNSPSINIWLGDDEGHIEKGPKCERPVPKFDE